MPVRVTNRELDQRLTRLESTVRDGFERIEKGLKDLSVVRIKNGGGREMTFKRSEFDQMIYDRPKEALTRAASFSDHALKILQFASTIIVMLWGLAQVVR
jgi:hypothetical protein